MARIEYRSISIQQIDNFALSNNYQANVANPDNPQQTIPNPETKLAFMERLGRQYFDGQCALGKRIARQAARAAEDIADAATVILPPGVITP